jgi:hypothetical protein
MKNVIRVFICQFITIVSYSQAPNRPDLDSTLKNAGATPTQIQQFKTAKALAITKTKQVKTDSLSLPEQKQASLIQIENEKNASYKTILGAEIYKVYNGIKKLKIGDQVNQTTIISDNKIVRDCLDSVGATNAQQQQFLATKRLYKDKMKDLHKNRALSAVQKKQQGELLKAEKNGKYIQILGQQKYTAYSLAKKRREEKGGIGD